MNKKLTQQQALEKLHKYHPNIDLIDQYDGENKKLMFQCKICGYRERVTPSILWQSKPLCAFCSPEKAVRWNNNNFQIFVKKHCQQIKSISPFKGMEILCTAMCIHNHTFKVSPKTIIQDKMYAPCPYCRKDSKIKKILTQFRIHNPYIVLLSYKNKEATLTFQCGKCGCISHATPMELIHGEMCPRCQHQKHYNWNDERFKLWADQNFPYLIIKGKYRGYDRPIKCMCVYHKTLPTFETRPAYIFANHTVCPQCNKFTESSFPEQAIYYYCNAIFKNVQNKYRPEWLTLGNQSELDIYLPETLKGKIGIEYDGEHWHQNKAKDQKKYVKCQQHGVYLIRIRQYDDKKPNIAHLEKTMCDKAFITKKGNSNLTLVIRQLLKFLLKPNNNVDVDRDQYQILSKYLSKLYSHNLAKCNPVLAKQFDLKRNYPLTPDMVPYYKSKNKYYWICPKNKNHHWKASLIKRINGSGCPDCALNRKKSKEDWNNIFRKFGIKIIKKGNSNKKSLFQCLKHHEHLFYANPSNKLSHLKKSKEKIGCPYCSGHRYRSKSDILKAIVKNNPNVTDVVIDKFHGLKSRVSYTCIFCGKRYVNATTAYHLLKGEGCRSCMAKRGHKLMSQKKFMSKLSSVVPGVIFLPDGQYNEKKGLEDQEVHVMCTFCGKDWWTRPYRLLKGRRNCTCGHSKQVICVETGETFPSARLAAELVGLKREEGIILCCKKRRQTSGGFHWEFKKAS